MSAQTQERIDYSDHIVILNAGISAIAQPRPVYHWDILQICLDGSLLEAAEIIDSYVSLREACHAASTMTAMARGRGEPFSFLVQKHTPVEVAAAVEF